MDEAPAKEEGGGVPAWVMTFADLMTLLMCFFVLLLAFSEMDAAKFKELSGSVKQAFGVQSEIEARTIPKGTSVIAREFSPGKPTPTMLDEVRQ
ncbi:MAG: flagellar motor protein MotB, partial [Pseudomonadota bacterium]